MADVSIYNALLRPPKSVAEYDAEAMANQQNRLTLQVGQNKLAEYQRGVQQESQLADVYKSAVGADGTVNRNQLYTGAAQAGLGAKLPGMQKGYAELDETAAKTAKQNADANETHIKAVNLKMGQVRDLFNNITTPQQAAQLVQGMYADADIGKLVSMNGDTVQSAISRIPSDPAKFAEWVQAASLNAEKLAAYRTPDANARLQAKTSTDNNNADNATSRANNQATVGASYANAAATRSIASATRDAATIQRDQATEMKLGDDYRMQSKGFKEVGEAYRTINATLDKAAASPAATLAAATKFMKLLDPGSVVRESELGMALAASGVLDRATNYFNVLQSGRVLTPNQVKDFKNITQQIYGAAQEGQRGIDASYTQQAKAYKLRPEMVVQDLGQNSNQGAAKITRPAKNAQGWALHTDASGNQAYVSPDGKQFKEVK
ncbi:MAG: hypothetical protein WKG03_00240 [Telluria sp.]